MILVGMHKCLNRIPIFQSIFADESDVLESGQAPEPTPADPEPPAKLLKGNGKPEEKVEGANKFARQKSVTRSSRLSTSLSVPAIPPESRLSSAPEKNAGTSQKQAKRKCELALDWAVFLKAPDEVLAARVAAIPEAERAGTHNVGAEFARRISLYQESSLTDFDKIVESVRSAGASVIEVDQAELPPSSGAETERSDRSEESKQSADVDERSPSDEEQAADDEPQDETDADQQELTEDELVTSADDPADPSPATGTEAEAEPRRESRKELASQATVPELLTESVPVEAEPTGMSLAVVIARVRGAIGPPEKYAGAKRKQGSRTRVSEAKQEPEQQASMILDMNLDLLGGFAFFSTSFAVLTRVERSRTQRPKEAAEYFAPSRI